MIDRIKSAVYKEITRLGMKASLQFGSDREEILWLQLVAKEMEDTIVSQGNSLNWYGEQWKITQDRIAAIEAENAKLREQLPKVVKPRELPASRDNGTGLRLCHCKKLVNRWYIFCHQCGAKLDWSDVPFR